MKVYIDTHEVIIFEGATVADAVLSYSKVSYKKVIGGKLLVIDCFGNPTEADGLLTDGQVLKLRRKPVNKL